MISGARQDSVKCIRRMNGFSLIEVLVAMVVTAVALLGLAKMESLAFSATRTASGKSLAAIEAASLAATMHANLGYWAAGTAPSTVNLDYTGASAVFTSSDSTFTGLLGTNQSCSTTCAPINMAAFDLQQWAADVHNALPSYSAQISCVTTSFPVSCTIQINWTEKTVAINSQGVNASTAMANPSFTLYVVP